MGWFERARREIFGTDEASSADNSTPDRQDREGNGGLLARIGSEIASAGEGVLHGAQEAGSGVLDAMSRAGEAVVESAGAAADGAQEWAAEILEDEPEAHQERRREATRSATTGEQAHRSMDALLVDRLSERVDEAVAGAASWVNDNVMSDPMQIPADLEPGETHTIGGSGRLGVGGTASDEGSMTLGRGDDGQYSLTLGGELGIGVGGGLGGTGPSEGQQGTGMLNNRANASLNAGPQVQYGFSDAAEAEVGMELLQRIGAHNSVHMISAGRSARPPGVSEADMAFLRQHTRGVELGGEVAASLTGTFGPRMRSGGDSTNAGGANARINGQAASRVRVETPEGEDGPTTIVFSEELSGGGSVNLGASGTRNGRGGGASNLASANGTRTSRAESRYALPPGVTAEDVLGNPSLLDDIQPTERLIVTDTTEEAVGGTSSGHIHQTTYSSDSGGLFDHPDSHESDVRLVNQERAETGMRSDVTVQETERDFDREGTNMNPSLTLGPFSLAGSFRDQRTHNHDPTMIRTESMKERRRRQRAGAGS